MNNQHAQQEFNVVTVITVRYNSPKAEEAQSNGIFITRTDTLTEPSSSIVVEHESRHAEIFKKDGKSHEDFDVRVTPKCEEFPRITTIVEEVDNDVSKPEQRPHLGGSSAEDTCLVHNSGDAPSDDNEQDAITDNEKIGTEIAESKLHVEVMKYELEALVVTQLIPSATSTIETTIANESKNVPMGMVSNKHNEDTLKLITKTIYNRACHQGPDNTP